MVIAGDSGYVGRGMRIDVDYQGGGGYAIARRELPLDLPANYEFTFWVRGTLPRENLEFKMIDSSGENVWWVNRRDVEFPARWTKVTIKRRHVSFAWGPKGGGELRRMAALEIALTAGSGGKGSVWLDELALTPLEPVTAYRGTPTLSASSSAPGHVATLAMDGRRATSWRSGSGDAQQLTIDFGQRRELGGLTVDWDSLDYAPDYDVLTSDDGARWDSVYAVRRGLGGRHYLYLPETETRYLRLRALWNVRGHGVAIREIAVKPLAWSATPNDFWMAVSRDAPHGSYPRYLDSVQTYWTLVGVSGDPKEGLLDEDGRLETDKGAFAIEPFLFTSGRLWSWADVTSGQSLEDDVLPIPSVRWRGAPLELTVTAFASGEPGASLLHARYRVANRSRVRRTGKVYLAIRPFQVNPPTQFLNTAGGFARIDTIVYDGQVARVNGDRVVVPVTRPDAPFFGAASLAQGEIVGHLRRDSLPSRAAAADAHGFASGAFAWTLDLAPGEGREIDIAISFRNDGDPHALSLQDDSAASRWTAANLDSVVSGWREVAHRVRIDLPPSAAAYSRSIQSNLAYILINRDGPAIQPGSRSYERSWIRDGSLTSSALLRLGHEREAREFIEWFARFQYPSGKVPCCVDARGADPVPEHDSHGELIFAIAEYARFTHDTAWARRMWPHVAKAVAYIDSLRAQRLTPEYQTGDRRAYHGLVPQSISHEGYSAKPMHSYWDDLFTLRGLKDAAWLARTLGKGDSVAMLEAKRDEFRRDVMDSYRLAMAQHGIDYLPGSVELGDFDATSTTIGVAPGGEAAALPHPALERTFERYWRNFVKRRASRSWRDYTPYEWRTVGTFVRLDQPARAHEVARWFIGHRRPAAWNAWAEVVRRDPRAPGFIGDLPHTWVGSDFIRSVLDMLAYERERDSSLVVGAGVPIAWAREANGVAVQGLRTEYGTLDLTIRGTARETRVHLAGDLRVPPGGIAVRAPFGARPSGVTIDGEQARLGAHDEVLVRRLPADVAFRYGVPRTAP